MRRPTKLNLILAVGFAAVSLSPESSLAQSCEDIFMKAHIDSFLRIGSEYLPNEILNPAAKAHLNMLLAKKLPKGSYSVDVDGVPQGLSVFAEGIGTPMQMRLTSGHVVTSESTKVSQSDLPGAEGNRSGIAVQYQLLPGEKLVITNTILSGNENTPLGLTKREITAEFDLSGTDINTIPVREVVTTLSVFQKGDVTFTLPKTIKIIAKR